MLLLLRAQCIKAQLSPLLRVLVKNRGSGRPGQGGQLTLKFGGEVRNCIWRLCRTGVKVTAISTCLTISTISMRGMKINISCYVIKLDFLPLTSSPVEQWLRCTCPEVTSCGGCFCNSICCLGCGIRPNSLTWPTVLPLFLRWKLVKMETLADCRLRRRPLTTLMTAGRPSFRTVSAQSSWRTTLAVIACVRSNLISRRILRCVPNSWFCSLSAAFIVLK